MEQPPKQCVFSARVRDAVRVRLLSSISRRGRLRLNSKSAPPIPGAIEQLQRQLDEFRSAQSHRTKLPETLWQAVRQKILEQEINPLKTEQKTLANAAPGQTFYAPVPYSEADSPGLFMIEVAVRIGPISREEAETEYRDEIAALEQQLLVAKLTPYVEQAAEPLEHVMPAITFVLAAYLFRLLIQRKRDRRTDRFDQAPHRLSLSRFGTPLLGDTGMGGCL